MLQLTLAREQLLCGYGNQMDASVDLARSGQTGRGARPNHFFGPARDALHLITRRVHNVIVIRPRVLKDLEPRAYILTLPGAPDDIAALWSQQIAELSGQIRPRVLEIFLQQDSSDLARDADIYQQSFSPIDAPSELSKVRLQIEAFVSQDSLRESWQLKGLDTERFEAFILAWHEPEIGAAQHFQSTVYHPETGTLCSYRGPVFFGVQAFAGSSTLPLAFADGGSRQWGQAAARFGEIVKATWQTDEFYGLSQSPALRRAPYLPLVSKSINVHGATDGLALWVLPESGAFELRFSLRKSLDGFAEALPAFEDDKNKVRAQDQAWVASKKPAPAALKPELKGLYARTLLTLKQMQDPTGGIIAAPEFHYALTHCGGYGYCWGRDAGFISYAMDVCGMHDESEAFYRYMKLCQSADGSFLHRHDMQGNLGASWGLLQPDETGSVVFGIWQHVLLSGRKHLISELKDMIDQAAHWLANARHSFDPALPLEGHDLWEEREGVHSYSVASMAAGLQGAVELYRLAGWEAPALWQTRYEELAKLVSSDRYIEKTGGDYRFARTLHRILKPEQVIGLPAEQHRYPDGRIYHTIPADYVVDISMAAITYPYDVLRRPDAEAVEKSLLKQLDQRLTRPGAGGVGRYEADYYRDGNPWMLTTLWLALGAAKAKDYELAKKHWQWTLKHVPAEGQLPEQIDPANGGSAWVMPLTWSHAMFALALQQLPVEVLN